MKIKYKRAFMLAAISLATSQGAFAAEYYYDFSLSSKDFNGSGVISSSDQSGDLTLDHAIGYINGLAIDDLSSFGGADNIYYGDGSVDYSGVSFDTDDGDSYNIFFGGVANANGPNFDADFIFSLSPHVSATSTLPEPATWTMMLVGLGFIGAARRRRQAVSVARHGLT